MKNKIISRMLAGDWYSTRDIARLVNGGNRGQYSEREVRDQLEDLAWRNLVVRRAAGNGFRWALTKQESTNAER